MSNIDFETEGTTTSTYDDVKQFYLDTYENIGQFAYYSCGD